MKKVLLCACLLSVMVGCATSANVKVCTFETGVGAQIHEWRGVDATLVCDNNDPPFRSSITAGFVTGCSHITLGGSPSGIGAGIDITWDNSKGE